MIDLALPTLNRLESLADLPPEHALARAVPALAGLAAEPRLLEAARDRSLHSLAPAPTGGTQAGEPYVACRHDGANIEPVRSRYSPGRPVRERRSMTTLAGERSVAW